MGKIMSSNFQIAFKLLSIHMAIALLFALPNLTQADEGSGEWSTKKLQKSQRIATENKVIDAQVWLEIINRRLERAEFDVALKIANETSLAKIRGNLLSRIAEFHGEKGNFKKTHQLLDMLDEHIESLEITRTAKIPNLKRTPINKLLVHAAKNENLKEIEKLSQRLKVNTDQDYEINGFNIAIHAATPKFAAEIIHAKMPANHYSLFKNLNRMVEAGQLKEAEKLAPEKIGKNPHTMMQRDLFRFLITVEKYKRDKATVPDVAAAVETMDQYTNKREATQVAKKLFEANLPELAIEYSCKICYQGFFSW